ncbi:MAG: 50S ribosomal protein L9 [Gammaproteobacteria bacterium AqS3]|nr:50S ribosomal protein L9 [Gammaproteobacteria bacterium AqS3]
MEVILLEKISNLGDLGEIVKVKNGYARNYLLPQGRALPATEAHRKQLEARLEELRSEASERLATAQQRADTLPEEVAISAHASSTGVLYGSLGAREIAEAISGTGQAVDRREIHLPEGSLRALGEYEIEVKLHPDLNKPVKVTVISA